MDLMKRFIGETEDGDIRLRLCQVLEHPLELGERAKFVKAMLGLLMEITSDTEQRMGFVGLSKLQQI
jgi:hypothetical protein